MVSSEATQEFIPIKEIRNGVAVLKTGGLRAVLMVSSLNFALKSEDEQKSIIYQFQNFLNSLDFSVQILAQSRKLDIRPYIALLETRYDKQTNDLLKIQIREYIDFVRNLATGANNIMVKSFFVVVSYDPPALRASGGIAALPFGKGEREKSEKKAENFEENSTQLEQRIAVAAQGLRATGLRTARLGTEELVELYYKMFNPGDTEKPIAVGS